MQGVLWFLSKNYVEVQICFRYKPVRHSRSNHIIFDYICMYLIFILKKVYMNSFLFEKNHDNKYYDESLVKILLRLRYFQASY